MSCCNINQKENISLVSKKGKLFSLKSSEIYFSTESKLGYLNEKTQLKNDFFIKVLPSNQFLDIETNKNRSARLNFEKLKFNSNKIYLQLIFF